MSYAITGTASSRTGIQMKNTVERPGPNRPDYADKNLQVSSRIIILT
jgi:hypothetical protein